MHKVLKLIILGDSGVGKTALLERFVNKRFSAHFKSTIGADFLMQEISEDDKVTTLQIWDTAGAERFSSLGRVYYRGADCCLLVFDVSVPRTIDSLKFWKSEFQQFCGASEDFPFIVLANKVDREDRCISNEEIQSWCSENGLSIVMETSSKVNNTIPICSLPYLSIVLFSSCLNYL
eukprot:TRINITY_DN587_c0_g1_i2.p1 TRINITY_DN587_c0_g1~~TRINITY_DN587_c0_g1_i2.p1  ORF type:complete len:177 (+),score=16.67 TRINITY_DN587_c0_g1_i2:28-558(+)